MENKQQIYFAQGALYEGYRPTYPNVLLEKILSQTKNRNNYLDVATGTGQLLFQMTEHFKHLTLGTDISESQLNEANKKAESLKSNFDNDHKILFLSGDCGELAKFLETNHITTKFSLITFAQAFHWFNMEKILQDCKEKLLEPEGVLTVIGYMIQGVHLNSPEEDIRVRANAAYKKFADTVLVESKFDQSILNSGYKNVPFEKYFTTTREVFTVAIPVTLDWVIGHLKTWSMYNIYVQKNKEQPEFQDPAEVCKLTLLEELEKAQKANQIQDSEKPFLLIVPYFLVIAIND